MSVEDENRKGNGGDDALRVFIGNADSVGGGLAVGQIDDGRFVNAAGVHRDRATNNFGRQTAAGAGEQGQFGFNRGVERLAHSAEMLDEAGGNFICNQD